MGDAIRVDPEQLRSAASQLAQVADQFGLDVDAFVSELDGYGQPWGGDDIGLLIGTAHDAVLDAALDCFDDNVDTMYDYSDNLLAMADNYDTVEGDNTQSFGDIGRDLDAAGR